MKLSLYFMISALSVGQVYAEESQSQAWEGQRGGSVQVNTTKTSTGGSYEVEATSAQGKSVSSQGTAQLTKDGLKIDTQTQTGQGKSGSFNGYLNKDGEEYQLSGQHNSLQGGQKDVNAQWKEGDIQKKLEQSKTGWQKRERSQLQGGVPTTRKPSSFSSTRTRSQPHRGTPMRQAGPRKRGGRR